ncbi:winged helix-turn-helix transcriptional regulator [Burkholderia sp. Ac-20384]|nr:winged helix-turn-helix transcriptional regulator [Burkholderia sp. Ac-20384]
MAFTRLIPNTTKRLLILPPCELVADGSVVSHVYSEVPSKLYYSITPLVGRSPMCRLILSNRRVISSASNE